MGWFSRLFGGKAGEGQQRRRPPRDPNLQQGATSDDEAYPLWLRNQQAAATAASGQDATAAPGGQPEAPGMAEQRLADDAAQPLQEAQEVAPADQGMAGQAPAADSPSVDSGSWDSSSFDSGSSDSGGGDSGGGDSGGGSGGD